MPEPSASVPVILIGGPPLSGKTTAARAMGLRLGRQIVSTDHLGEAARALTDPATHADLHACNLTGHQDYYTAFSPEALLEQALGAHRALWPAVRAVINRHLNWAEPIIIEGWALLPDLLASMASPKLRCVWIEVPEPTLRSRLEADASFARGASDPALLITRFVERSLRMQDWLRERVSLCGLPLIELSGREPPDQVASLCMEAMGIGLP